MRLSACARNIRRRRARSHVAATLPVLVTAAAVLLSTADADGELAGLTLRCCTLVEAPYIIDQPPPSSSSAKPRDPMFANWSGLAIDTLILLEQRLGFKCSSFVPYSRPENQYKGFSGYVSYISSCSNGTGSSDRCDCDLGVGSWSMTSARSEQADLVAPFSSDGYVAVTRVDLAKGQKTNPFFFISTFAWPVWVAIIGVFILHISVTALDPNFYSAESEDGTNTYSNGSWWQRFKAWLVKHPQLRIFRLAVFNSAYHLLGQVPHFGPDKKKGTKGKVLGMIALLMGAFLVTVFQASINVQVILSSPSPAFVSVMDFESCRIPPDRVVLHNQTTAYTFWQDAIARTSCHLESANNVPGLAPSFDDAFKSVLSGQYDYYYTLEGQALWETYSKAYCGKLAVVGSSFFQNSVSFVLPKKSPHTLNFSLATLQIRELGLIPASTEYVDARRSCAPLTNPTLGWNMLHWFFYLAFAAEGVMFFFMLIDRGELIPDDDHLRQPQPNKSSETDGVDIS